MAREPRAHRPAPGPTAPPAPEVTVTLTKRLAFRLGDDGALGAQTRWTQFAAAVHKMAEEIPDGCDPMVSTRGGVIYVSWEDSTGALGE